MAEEPTYFLSGFDRISTLPAGTNAILSNAPSILSSRKLFSNLQHHINKKSPRYFMIDSGGKQIFKITAGQKTRFNGFTSDPEKPMHYEGAFNWSTEHWKKSILKDIPDFVISLDYPLPPGDTLSAKNSRYKKARNLNLLWAKESLEIRKKYFPETKIFVPYQGSSLRQLDSFVDDISGNDFDGLCLPMRCYQDTAKLVYYLKHIRSIGIKKVHLLGTAKLDVIAIVNYLSYHNYFDFISYDSCTVAHSARARKIMLPFDLRSISLSKRAGEIINILKIESLKSKVINHYELRDVQNMEEKDRRRWLTDYNYSSLMTTKKELFRNSKSINSIVRYLSDRSVRLDVIDRIRKSLQEIESS